MTTAITRKKRQGKPRQPKLVPRTLPLLGLGQALSGREEEKLLLDVIRRKEPFRYYGRDPS